MLPGSRIQIHMIKLLEQSLTDLWGWPDNTFPRNPYGSRQESMGPGTTPNRQYDFYHTILKGNTIVCAQVTSP